MPSRSGADVIIASRKPDACEAVAEEVRALGRRALAVPTHVGRWDECDRLMDTAYEAFGRVDILVNNAGMSPPSPSHLVTEQLFDAVMNLNFKGPFRLASAIAHRMAHGVGRGRGDHQRLLLGRAPLPGVVPYGASKAALNALTLSLAHEYGPKVRVNTLSAGPFLTDIANAWSPEARETARKALRRPGQPDEIVTAACAWPARHPLMSPARCCAVTVEHGRFAEKAAGL